ncbi:MAG TPA: DUF6496 domain-containing protein [bacterium]|nr:DUF6496 domain-containing protein [bacterium]
MAKRSTRSTRRRRYGQAAQKYVERAMRKRKHGTLRSGKRGPGKGKKVTSPEQAVAIGLSEAREKGAKVPPPPKH